MSTDQTIVQLKEDYSIYIKREMIGYDERITLEEQVMGWFIDFIFKEVFSALMLSEEASTPSSILHKFRIESLLWNQSFQSLPYF